MSNQEQRSYEMSPAAAVAATIVTVVFLCSLVYCSMGASINELIIALAGCR